MRNLTESARALRELLSQRIPVTLELTLLSMFLAVAVGVPLGVRAAVGGRWTRRLCAGTSTAPVVSEPPSGKMPRLSRRGPTY